MPGQLLNICQRYYKYVVKTNSMKTTRYQCMLSPPISYLQNCSCMQQDQWTFLSRGWRKISPYFSEQFYDRNKLTIPVSIRRRRKKTRKKMDRRQWTKHISSPLKCDFYYVFFTSHGIFSTRCPVLRVHKHQEPY